MQKKIKAPGCCGYARKIRANFGQQERRNLVGFVAAVATDITLVYLAFQLRQKSASIEA